MNENNGNKVKSALVLTTQTLAALGSVDPVFAGVSLITGLINELIVCHDAEQLEKRLNMLEDEIKRRDVMLESLQNRIDELEEHSYYVLRNNIRCFCSSSYPEVAEIYSKCIVDYLINQNHDMEEEICEILQQCNSNDIQLMNLVKEFIYSGSHEEAEEEKKKIIKDVEDINSGVKKYRDRSIIYGEYTIFWKDFMKENHVRNVEDMTMMLNNQLMADGKDLVYDWAYLSRAIVKLSNLGVLQLEYRNKLGTNSPFNIDRFHVTLFGRKLLEYL
ncbi:hypothetical protein SAMN04487829_1954 [Pseudobutyrivibrio sp. NOR37]|uniref:Uncharacterized protein n=2 Tax=Pseudobutyrivibrio TaxID=46205 RepID=A0A2G3E9J3_9FIRM|nr:MULTISPECIES: hypothetical protein [Pseudobutyrivibrio]NEX02328.1 hypothetical protein [Pseudobutyrivibrio xylanivorans]PHU39773.1 hypothetical protein CSX00_09420 [Pseudobutyrivibrio ruminis]SFR78183.1 hypothetical protein SAMN04487829_1954 [Pseudobutyrivibrio sp. NOR37]